MYILYGIAAGLFYWWLGGASLLLMSGLLATITALVWILWIPSWGRLLPPLHRAETKVSPRLLTLLRLERRLQWNHAILGFWSFLSLCLCILPFMTHTFPEWFYHALISGWFILTGLLLEWLTRQYAHTAALLDPFQALIRIEKEARKAKDTQSDIALEQWSEVIEEITARSLDRDATALASSSIQTLSNITEGYIQKNASRLSPSAPEESQHAARYVLHSVVEKYADLYARAQREGHHGICEQILTGSGKLAIIASEKNPSLAAEPIERIGQLGLENMEIDKRDLGLKTTRLLMQIAKRIASQKRPETVSIEKPFLSLLNSLEKIAKESFRKNKDTPISLLIEPFKEIQTIFTESACSTSPGAEIILQKDDQILADFANLELILRTMPTIPGKGEEEREGGGEEGEKRREREEQDREKNGPDGPELL